MFARNQLGQRFSFLQSHRVLIVLFLLVPLIVMLSASESVRGDSRQTTAQLPLGFTNTIIVAGMTLPTDMEWLPNGDILVAEKGTGSGRNGVSRVRLVRNGVLQGAPVVELSTNVEEDSGILGLAIDPDFERNYFFYLWYASGDEALNYQGRSVYRLSRFTLDLVGGIVIPGSEAILLDGVAWHQIHGGGSLIFDELGNLFIGIGDTNRRDHIQNLAEWAGKVIRIRPNETGYEISPDNPFVSTAGAKPEIYAYGVRNPFRMTRRSGGQMYFGDVGQRTWEEVNLLAPGVDYGWPSREGPCEMGRLDSCSPTPAHLTDPVLYYPHPRPETGGAVTALAFYEGRLFPDEYRDNLFYADFNSQTLWAAELGESSFKIKPFGTNMGRIVDLEYRYDELYYLDIEAGVIGLISYEDSDNQIPIAVLETDQTFGPAPLMVNFSAAASSDADDYIVAYHWDFGDGSQPVVTTTPEVSHVFPTDNIYNVQLKVVDRKGGESEVITRRIDVYSGEVPQVLLTIQGEAGRQFYRGGDTLQYRAWRNNGTSGLDPVNPYRWRVDFHHNQHRHPTVVDHEVVSDMFTISTDNHSGDENVWYRFSLTTRTEMGQEFVVSREIFPDYANISVAAVPFPVEVAVNNALHETHFQWKAIVGTKHTLAAPADLLIDGQVAAFQHWEVYTDNWPASIIKNEDNQDEDNIGEQVEILDDPSIVITVPVSSTSYIAHYQYMGPARQTWLPLIGAP